MVHGPTEIVQYDFEISSYLNLKDRNVFSISYKVTVLEINTLKYVIIYIIIKLNIVVYFHFQRNLHCLIYIDSKLHGKRANTWNNVWIH